MNALHEGRFDRCVALAARRRHIEFVDRRLRIVGRKNLMRAVAIRAHRRLRRSLLSGLSVYALLVRRECLRTLPRALHQKLLPVAPSAGIRNVVVIHRRLRIVRPDNLVRPTVAVLAICRRRSTRFYRFA